MGRLRRIALLIWVVLAGWAIPASAFESPDLQSLERQAIAAASAALSGGLMERAPLGDFGKDVQRSYRRFGRTLYGALIRWQSWAIDLIWVGLVVICLPAVDRRLLEHWRGRDLRSALRSLGLGMVVNLKLLVDRRAPILGKMLVFLAGVYGVAERDIVDDRLWPLGLVDDFIVVAVASRSFVQMCSESLIAEHAHAAARRWALSRSRRVA